MVVEPAPAEKTDARARVLWQLAFDHELRTPPIALADGVIFLLERGRRSVLRRVDVISGETVWTQTLAHRANGGVARTGKLLAVPLSNGRVSAHRLEDGAPLDAWDSLGAALRPPVAALDGRVFARSGVGMNARLNCLVPGRRAPLWSCPDPVADAHEAIFRETDGALLVAGAGVDGDVLVACLDPETGAQRWVYRHQDAGLNDLWAVGGIIDVVTTTSVVGLSLETGERRNTRFESMPLDCASAAGQHLIAMMQGHMGPVLLCFDSVSQSLSARVTRAMTGLVGAHPGEVMVQLKTGIAALYRIPDLTPLDFPEAESIGVPGRIAFAGDVAYVVAAHGRSLTAIGLEG